MYLLHTLERENASLTNELDATTIASSASAPSTAPPPEFIAATITTGRDDALISALTAQSATQAAQITKLLAALTAGGRDDVRRGGGKKCSDSGRGNVKPNPKHKYCKNCKRVVAHEAAKFYQLQSNTASRPDWWKQDIHGIS